MQLPSTHLVTLLATLAASPAIADTGDTERARRMDTVIDRAITQQRIVGAVVIVIHDGQIIYERAAGYADREAKSPMAVDTIFRLASVTKPIVSALTLRLVEEGKLSLSDPVSRWLPGFRPKMADGSSPQISVKQLLTHTAGLSYGFLEAENGPYRTARVSDGLAEPDMSLDDNLKRIASVPLSYPPGSQWQYSMATDVLGALLEQAGGKPLPELTAELITGPLDLKDSAFSVRDPARLAAAYRDATPQPLRMQDGTAIRTGESTTLFSPSRILNPNAYPSAGAGMAGTAADIARFLETLRQGGQPILSASSVQQMMTDQVGAQAQTQGPGWGFGYGWAVLDDPELASTPQSRGTLQWGGAYGHSWFVDPQARLTVVALTNTTFEGMSGAFTREVRDAVYPAK